MSDLHEEEKRVFRFLGAMMILALGVLGVIEFTSITEEMAKVVF